MIVRTGTVGYSEDETPGRKTLLYEGTTVRSLHHAHWLLRSLTASLVDFQLAKILLLVLIVYTYYVASVIAEDDFFRLVCTTGFFVAIAVAVLPLVRRLITWRGSTTRCGSHLVAASS